MERLQIGQRSSNEKNFKKRWRNPTYTFEIAFIYFFSSDSSYPLEKHGQDWIGVNFLNYDLLLYIFEVIAKI